MIVYSSDITNPPATLEELAKRKIPVHVQENSSYHTQLKTLQAAGIQLNIIPFTDALDTETALMQVSNGTFMATVSDDNIFHATNRYLGGLRARSEERRVGKE